MPTGRRRSKLSAIVEDTTTEEVKTEDLGEPKFVEVASPKTASPLLKEILAEDYVFLIESELMEIDTTVLIKACSTMGYDIPSEGKNTNKKVRSIILENGGKMPSEFKSSPTEGSTMPMEETVATITKTATSTGKVYIEKSVTKNMGDYNSAKVTVGIELPIDYVDAELAKADDTVSVALELVDRRLEDEVTKLM